MSRLYRNGLRLAIIAAVLLLQACATWNPNRKSETEQSSKETVAAFKREDPSMKKFFDAAYAYAVFPTVGKGAIGIGGAHGQGAVFHRGAMVGYTSLTQVTVGFQLGGQAYSEIIFFKDKARFDNFKNGNLKFSAQASAVAATAGAAATANYENGIAVFTLVKGGLMYEASIGGQGFSYEPLK
jgi:lipid-binding SYLF domain-containing protein